MSTSIKHTLILFTVLFTVVCFQSCKKEGCTDPNAVNFNSDADTDDGSCIIQGCTDPNAENYNSGADQDDGSCTFARDKFIGTYGAGESCDGGQATGLVVSITESATNTNSVLVTNETEGITIAGTVSGNTLNLNDTVFHDGQDLTVLGTGSYSIDSDGEEKIEIEYALSVVVGGQSITSNCLGVWIKAP